MRRLILTVSESMFGGERKANKYYKSELRVHSMSFGFYLLHQTAKICTLSMLLEKGVEKYKEKTAEVEVFYFLNGTYHLSSLLVTVI